MQRFGRVVCSAVFAVAIVRCDLISKMHRRVNFRKTADSIRMIIILILIEFNGKNRFAIVDLFSGTFYFVTFGEFFALFQYFH